MCVCTHTHMHTHIQTHIYRHTYILTYTLTHTYIHTYTHTNTSIQLYFGLIVHACMYVCMYVCENNFVCFFQAKILTSKKKAIFAVSFQTVASVTVNSYMMWMVDYSTPNCKFLHQFYWFSKVGKGIMFLVGSNVLPLCIISVCYTILVVLVYTRRKPQSQVIKILDSEDTLIQCIKF